jgi:uncharacterized membrane protein YgdD (TMEM256/DUF423 family)
MLSGLAGTNWTAPTAFWIKLHTAEPGAAGATAAAVETTRKQATFGAPSTSGANQVMSNSGALTWTTVAGSEDYTHWSGWTASTAGTFLFSGTITANPVTAGDTMTFAIGAFVLSIPIAT